MGAREGDRTAEPVTWMGRRRTEQTVSEAESGDERSDSWKRRKQAAAVEGLLCFDG